MALRDADSHCVIRASGSDCRSQVVRWRWFWPTPVANGFLRQGILRALWRPVCARSTTNVVAFGSPRNIKRTMRKSIVACVRRAAEYEFGVQLAVFSPFQKTTQLCAAPIAADLGDTLGDNFGAEFSGHLPNLVRPLATTCRGRRRSSVDYLAVVCSAANCCSSSGSTRVGQLARNTTLRTRATHSSR